MFVFLYDTDKRTVPDRNIREKTPPKSRRKERLVSRKEKKKKPWSRWYTICPIICITSFLALDGHAAKEKSGNVVAIKAGQSCATSECHPVMGKDKFVHGPVAAGDCSFCHKQDQKDQHTFQPITNIEALCYECHEKINTNSLAHKPAADGPCTKCHDPHQSANLFQLKDGHTGGGGS
jgi:predicted CXXCH cytochrome family protein